MLTTQLARLTQRPSYSQEFRTGVVANQKSLEAVLHGCDQPSVYAWQRYSHTRLVWKTRYPRKLAPTWSASVRSTPLRMSGSFAAVSPALQSCVRFDESG